MLNEFKKYVNNFYTGDNDSGISLKYAHSLRVQKIMEDMAISFNFSKEQIEIAKVIGLLHDYGRFYQWKTYNTFYDNKSVDHADYGVELLFENGDITKYYINKKNYNIIKTAILHHNKYNSPKDTYSKMIRDADKLDIMYLFSLNETYNEKEEISKEVIEDFNNKKLINDKHKKTETDVIVKIFAYVFDLNYTFSFKYLKENYIIENIYKKIKDKEKFKYYFDKINEYINDKIKEMDYVR